MIYKVHVKENGFTQIFNEEEGESVIITNIKWVDVLLMAMSILNTPLGYISDDKIQQTAAKFVWDLLKIEPNLTYDLLNIPDFNSL